MPNRYKAINRYVLAMLLFALALLTAFRVLRAGGETSATEGRIDGIRKKMVEDYPSRSYVGGVRRRWRTVDWRVYSYEVKGIRYRKRDP